ncbi:mitochondrial carrier domain-containing protein [Morchella snyderi]|nr:mitochondrial carrier domain-containing protein [Morchella snyderi]
MSANMIAGPIAGIVTCLMFYPFDTIKTRLQSPEYHRAAQAGVQRIRLQGLYQGVGPIILATLPASAAFFTSYQKSREFLRNASPSLPSPVINCAGSMAAEMIASAVATPAEVIKQNAQVLSGKSTSTSTSTSLQALRLIGRNPRNLWRGYTLLAGRNLPFIAIQFPIYEELKALLGSGAVKGDLWETGRISGLAAMASGGIAACLTTPIDVVKTRVMLTAGDAGRRIGAVETFEGVWKTEGVRGVFRGGALRTVWTSIGSGVYLALYESLIAYARDRSAPEAIDI